MDYEDLESRVSELEEKSFWWDIGGYLAGGIAIFGLISLIKDIWGWISNFIS